MKKRICAFVMTMCIGSFGIICEKAKSQSIDQLYNQKIERENSNHEKCLRIYNSAQYVKVNGGLFFGIPASSLSSNNPPVSHEKRIYLSENGNLLSVSIGPAPKGFVTCSLSDKTYPINKTVNTLRAGELYNPMKGSTNLEVCRQGIYQLAKIENGRLFNYRKDCEGKVEKYLVAVPI